MASRVLGTVHPQEDGINNPYPPIAASIAMKDEVFEAILRVFRRYDTDHDGYIGSSDYAAMSLVSVGVDQHHLDHLAALHVFVSTTESVSCLQPRSRANRHFLTPSSLRGASCFN